MRCISALFVDIWSSQTHCKLGPVKSTVKFWLWILKLKNWPVEPFKVPLSKQNMQKNVFGGHFPTEHKGLTGYWQINKLWITVPDSDIFVISYKVDLQQYKRCCPYITLRMVLQSDTWYKLTEYSVICYLLSTPKYCSFIFVQLSFNE